MTVRLPGSTWVRPLGQKGYVRILDHTGGHAERLGRVGQRHELLLVGNLDGNLGLAWSARRRRTQASAKSVHSEA